MGWGGGGRKICLFSSYSSVHLGVGGGGGGGMGWEASLHEEYFHYMIILHCLIKSIGWGGGWGGGRRGGILKLFPHEEYFQYIYVYKLQGRRATCLFFVEGLNNVYSCFPVYG